MRRALLGVLDAAEGGLCLLWVLEVAEVIRCVLLYMPEAVACGLCLPEALEVRRC